MGESFWSLSYPGPLQPESQVSPGQGAYPQAGWGLTASWRSNLQAGRGRLASQELVSGKVEACQPPGIPGLADPWAGWGMTTFQGPDP